MTEPDAGAPPSADSQAPAQPAGHKGTRRAWFKRVGGRLLFIGRRRKPAEIPVPNPEHGLRVLVVTDAWHPQVNGVVRTLETLGEHLEKLGNEVRYITPDMFRTIPLPTYSEIRLALAPYRRIARIINEFKPDAIHIATEGPLGMAARRFCVRRQHPFTTSLHTRFPEYVNARTKLPVSWGYKVLRWFHRPASAVMVATPTLMEEMRARGLERLRIWSRGVDMAKFRPAETREQREYLGFARPIWLYVGRVAVEKNVEAFLKEPLEGTKVIVGSGPQLEELKQRFPEAKFLGPKFGPELAATYAAADVFVFPSRTDTFGLVNVEALASGVPVAAYPVQGPLEIIEGSGVGALDEDLGEACRKALGIADAAACRAHAQRFSWEACTKQFLANLDIPGYDESYWDESALIEKEEPPSPFDLLDPGANEASPPHRPGEGPSPGGEAASGAPQPAAPQTDETTTGRKTGS